MIAHAVTLAIVLLLPGLSRAQGPRWARVLRVSLTPQAPLWDFSISGFGGLAIPFDPHFDVTDPATSTDFTAKDLGLDNSLSFGGKIGAWNTATRRTIGLDFGAEIDVTRFTPDFDPQRVNASGTLAGAAITTFQLPTKLDVNATIVAVNLLVREVRGLAPDLPHGRWQAYIGIGGGFEIVHADLLGGGDDTDTSPALQVLAGLKIFFNRYVAIFAEYKFSHADHTFQVGTRKNQFSLSANHVAGGLAIHFTTP